MTEIRPGKLLVASPLLEDPNFRRAVVLVCMYSDEGTMGVVLNRPLEIPVVDRLAAWSELVASPAVFFDGGPVEPNLVVALARGDSDRLSTSIEPGFGLANLIGIAAVLITIALLATSTDWALHRLGASAWKFLHNSVYIIFWLILLHTAYFLFIHYSPHFHRLPPPPDWFRYPFLILTLGLIALQTTAFINTIRLRKLRAPA